MEEGAENLCKFRDFYEQTWQQEIVKTDENQPINLQLAVTPVLLPPDWLERQCCSLLISWSSSAAPSWLVDLGVILVILACLLD